MSGIVVVGIRSHYVIVPKLNTQHMTDLWRDHSSGVLGISSISIQSQAKYWWNADQCTGNWVYVDVSIFVEEAY